jgi:hypothetical protein
MTPMLGWSFGVFPALQVPVRSLVPLVVAVLSLALAAGCGGSDKADSSTDVNKLLDETFASGKSIKSGRIDLALDVRTQAAEATSPVKLKLSGPFQSMGETRLPKLALTATFEGGGTSLDGGLTSTGDRGFVAFQGTSYEVSGPVFEQFKAGYEQTAKEAAGREDSRSPAALGIDPRRWLTNARNAGESEVGDTDTVKITGSIDVPKLLDDVNAALEKLRGLAPEGTGDLPEQLTEEQKLQVAEAIEDVRVEIHTGAEDRILRRIVIALRVKAPQGTTTTGAQAADVRFALQLLDVNENQEIKAPENARPFKELVAKLDQLGLGGLGPSGSRRGAGSGGPGEANLEKYSRCIQEAAGDNAKVRRCAELLTP